MAARSGRALGGRVRYAFPGLRVRAPGATRGRSANPGRCRGSWAFGGRIESVRMCRGRVLRGRSVPGASGRAEIRLVELSSVWGTGYVDRGYAAPGSGESRRSSPLGKLGSGATDFHCVLPPNAECPRAPQIIAAATGGLLSDSPRTGSRHTPAGDRLRHWGCLATTSIQRGLGPHPTLCALVYRRQSGQRGVLPFARVSTTQRADQSPTNKRKPPNHRGFSWR